MDYLGEGMSREINKLLDRGINGGMDQRMVV